MLKRKAIKRAMGYFGIEEGDLEKWRLIRASDVLSIPGVGEKLTNDLRLYLAHRGISLKCDNQPEYWIETLGKPVGEPPGELKGTCPFTIVVDGNETFPFTFESIYDGDGKLVSVPTVRRQMWRDGLADYSIVGYESDIQIERKGDDLASSLADRREAFEHEIARLDQMCEFAAIVCEQSWSDVLSDQHEHGARAKSISRTYVSWAIKYPGVHWIMCAGRYHAEQVTFRLLERFWWSKQFEASHRNVVSGNDSLFCSI